MGIGKTVAGHSGSDHVFKPHQHKKQKAPRATRTGRQLAKVSVSKLSQQMGSWDKRASFFYISLATALASACDLAHRHL